MVFQLPTIARKYLSSAWKHRWPAVFFTWLVCAGGWFMVMTIPNVYESSARLYVDADAVLNRTLGSLRVDNDAAGQLDVLQRTLLSRPNLEKLISKTSLELDLKGPSDRESLVENLATAIKINPQTRNLFTISYRNSSPQLSYDVVRTMLTTFVESKRGISQGEMDSAGRFLNEQIAKYERQLQDAERRRAEFRAKYVDVLPAADGGASRLDGQQARIRELQGQLEDATARRDALTRELNNTPQQITTETDGPGGGNSPLRDAQRVLQELRTRYTDRSPEVIGQLAIINAIKSGGSAAQDGTSRSGPRSRTASNPVFEALKTRVVDNDSVIASLTRQMNDALRERDRLSTLARSAPQVQADFANVNRDYDVLRKNYDDLLARRESMRISVSAEAEGDKVKVQIIDPPQVPQNPIAPKRVLLLSGVLLGGLGAGAALAFLLTQFDRSFHTLDDLRELGFPVVGGVSMMAVAVPFARRIFSLGLFAAAVVAPLVVYGGLLRRLLKPSGLV